MNMKKLLRYVSCLPKTVCFNLKAFNIRTAVRLPVLVGRRVRVKSLHRGSIVLPSGGVPMFGIKLGVNAVGGKSRKTHSYLMVEKGGRIVFSGLADLCHGFGLLVGKAGTLRFGANLFANDDFYCVCEKGVSIGDNAHIGWNTSYRDYDGHDILCGDTVINPPKEITIGSHVWICTDVSFLKGVSIPDNTIIAQGSLVTKSFSEQGTVIAGSPAKVVKRDVTWRI